MKRDEPLKEQDARPPRDRVAAHSSFRSSGARSAVRSACGMLSCRSTPFRPTCCRGRRLFFHARVGLGGAVGLASGHARHDARGLSARRIRRGRTLAVIFNQSRLIEYSLYPYAVILQVTPIVAIAPLLLIYLPQQLAVLACAWIVAFFPVLANTTLGLNSVDRNLADLFRLYGATRRAGPDRAQAAGGASLYSWRAEDRRRAVSDRGGRRRDCGGIGWRRFGACLPHCRVRLPPQYSPHVRGAAATLAERDRHFLRALFHLTSVVAALA